MENGKDLGISLLADIYGKLLTRRQLEILREYYDYDSSLAEIAEKYGIARQSVKDSLKAARESLENMEEKLGLLKKNNAINAKIDCIMQNKSASRKEIEDALAEIKNSLNGFTE